MLTARWIYDRSERWVMVDVDLVLYKNNKIKKDSC